MGRSFVVEVVPVPVVPVVVSSAPGFSFEAVKIVMARLGIVLSPEFATARVRLVFWASCCLLGKSALTIWTGKSPDGSFASCRVPPQEAIPAARSTPKIPIPIRLRAFEGPAVEALSSKAAGNIPRTVPPSFRLRIVSSGDFSAWPTPKSGYGWRSASLSHNLPEAFIRRGLRCRRLM